MYYLLTVFSSRYNFFPREPLDQLEISAITECELKRFSGAFRAGAPSPLVCLPRACPFSLSPTTSKRLLRKLYREKETQKNLREGSWHPPPPISFPVRPRVKVTLINLGGAQCLVAINIDINRYLQSRNKLAS